MHFSREGPKVGQVWGKKPEKDPEELPYINDLMGSLWDSSSLGWELHPFFPGVHLCLASTSTKQTNSLCALPLAVVLHL